MSRGSKRLAAMRARGYPIDFTIVPGVEHRLTRPMTRAVRSWIVGTLFPGRFPGAMRAEPTDRVDDNPIGGPRLPRPAQAEEQDE